MVSYNSSDVVQSLRQYDMFANSLNLVKTKPERDMIVKQLTKLENKIIELTNDIYEEEYFALANKECGLLDEETNRLNALIDLINQRLSYVEKRYNNHYQLTGESIDAKDVLGANTLDELEDRLKIIAKYGKNIKLASELEEEIKSLTSKISLASEKIEINKSLNVELETKFCELLTIAFEKCGFYDLLEIKDEIEDAYYETEKSLTLAELNLESARTSPLNILNECQMMLDDVKNDYIKYKEKLSILKLMELFNREVSSYDELLNKRKEVNDLIKHIKNEEFLDIVIDTINKQFNTIMMEQQDVNTFNDLSLEKTRKLEVLAEIEEENESERFQSVLEVLIENEKKRQEKIREEQERLMEEEKKKRLEIERKKQEEILKRQKVIEEVRKKEIEKRTKKMLEQQQKSVLQPKKKDDSFSFETIKDITENEDDSNKKVIIDEFEVKPDKVNDLMFEMNSFDEDEKEENVALFKNKVDIEKELFDEFNGNTNDVKEEENDDSEELFFDDKKLPDISIDEYMKNFNENSIEDNDNFFGDDDMFPTIPVN